MAELTHLLTDLPLVCSLLVLVFVTVKLWITVHERRLARRRSRLVVLLQKAVDVHGPERRTEHGLRFATLALLAALAAVAVNLLRAPSATFSAAALLAAGGAVLDMVAVGLSFYASIPYERQDKYRKVFFVVLWIVLVLASLIAEALGRH